MRRIPLAALAACAPQLGVPTEPLSLAGYEPVTLDLSDTTLLAADVDRVVIAGVAAYGLEATRAHELVVRVQGAPAPGPQPVELHVGDEVHRFEDALTFAPPLDPRLGTVVALGASITEGVQGGVPTQHAILHNPPHLVARSLGVYLPLPLLVDPLFPPIGWDDIGPSPACAIPSVVGHVAGAAIQVLGTLEDEEEDRIGFYLGRVDPELAPHDVAVGDTNVGQLVHGPPADPTRQFLVKLVYAPDAGITDIVETSQLELVEALRPDLVLVTDTYGNDLIKSIVARDLDASLLTPVDTFEEDLAELLDRLSATGAEVFVANMPPPTVLPAAADKRAQAIAASDDPASTAAEIDGILAEIDARGAAFGAILDAQAAAYDNVHVVDFGGRVLELQRDGLDVDGTHLTIAKFGGLLSTDGVHLGDVGNGVVAQLFLDAIAEVYGLEPPPVDLSALLAGDPHGPAAAEAAGFDRSACGVPGG